VASTPLRRRLLVQPCGLFSLGAPSTKTNLEGGKAAQLIQAFHLIEKEGIMQAKIGSIGQFHQDGLHPLVHVIPRYLGGFKVHVQATEFPLGIEVGS